MSEIIIIQDETPEPVAEAPVVIETEPVTPASCAHADAVRAELEPRVAALELAAVALAVEVEAVAEEVVAAEDAALEAAIAEAEMETEMAEEESVDETPAAPPVKETTPEPEEEKKPKRSGMSSAWFGKRSK